MSEDAILRRLAQEAAGCKYLYESAVKAWLKAVCAKEGVTYTEALLSRAEAMFRTLGWK
jgi:hypothetical protein